MVLILPEYSQRPYRYGMTLLCVGAMFNWLGLAENNAEPVRYIGVTLIAAGAMLICLAMCFWMKASHDPPSDSSQSDEQVHHIVTIHQSSAPLEKPPDYDSVTGCLPPCYEDAIRLNPSLLLPNISSAQDETDSQKPESDVPAGESQSTTTNIPAPPYSAINIPMNITTNLKNDNTTNKSISTITNNSSNDNNIIITNEVSTNLAEESSQISNNDNFGSKVLRLSKRLLRGGGGGGGSSSASKQHVSSQDGESSSTENSINVITTNAPSSAAHSITTNTISDVVTSSNDLPSPSSVIIVDRNSSLGPSTSNLPVR